MSPIDKIAAQCGEPDLLQRISDACHNKQAFLFLRGTAGCVLRPLVEDGVVGVLVWAAWSCEQGGMDTYTGFIQQRAREIGARWIRFHTVRPGFKRVSSKYGWQRQADDAQGRMVFQMTL
ncbi:hypothetical protein [Pseudaeromonas paramecii]|uniref:N-acetyltransferase domain-containing protein n=1 Tax=Pseudaeromonas paramecii TaxID=2138166 RepID=A0ABP8PYT4_9GAMM